MKVFLRAQELCFTKNKAKLEHSRVKLPENSTICSVQGPSHQSHLLLRKYSPLITQWLSPSWTWIQNEVAGTGNYHLEGHVFTEWRVATNPWTGTSGLAVTSKYHIKCRDGPPPLPLSEHSSLVQPCFRRHRQSSSSAPRPPTLTRAILN